MNLSLAPYEVQQRGWPSSGRHITAQYDDATVVVYQAFRSSIARYAVAHQTFGGDFSFQRMSWVKPNFLWMMYRCGWATKDQQERVLAIRIKRNGFDDALSSAVYSAFVPGQYASREAWASELKTSSVRLQWDPVHDPSGLKVERRAIQLGLAGEFLRRYAAEWIAELQDITEFVEQQRLNSAKKNWNRLVVPVERAYRPESSATVARLRFAFSEIDARGEATP